MNGLIFFFGQNNFSEISLSQGAGKRGNSKAVTVNQPKVSGILQTGKGDLLEPQ